MIWLYAKGRGSDEAFSYKVWKFLKKLGIYVSRNSIRWNTARYWGNPEVCMSIIPLSEPDNEALISDEDAEIQSLVMKLSIEDSRSIKNEKLSKVIQEAYERHNEVTEKNLRPVIIRKLGDVSVMVYDVVYRQVQCVTLSNYCSFSHIITYGSKPLKKNGIETEIEIEYPARKEEEFAWIETNIISKDIIKVTLEEYFKNKDIYGPIASSSPKRVKRKTVGNYTILFDDDKIVGVCEKLPRGKAFVYDNKVVKVRDCIKKIVTDHKEFPKKVKNYLIKKYW